MNYIISLSLYTLNYFQFLLVRVMAVLDPLKVNITNLSVDQVNISV